MAEIETELEREIEKEKEKVEVKIEEKKNSEKFEKEKTVEIEEASDAEIEKLELSEEEKNTEAKAEKESELLSAQRSREAMLGRMEKEPIEEHNRELDEAIKQSKSMIEHNQSLIESLGRMKNINERRLGTLKVKGTPYTPASEKPKRAKHTAGKHKVHGRKPPLHPSSKRPESSIETVPAQNLRSSKRPRTDPKSLRFLYFICL
ncbi:hypothetical protein JCGZ_03266 [Jatropha curcas]|uniref:Uncharacterized protein n=1 Tax=Jatropha curcas TaxID=180498 RepID=A0A067LC32_JATCU|nr:hypothetical protein JCGZ_03266 [Jatropha curcas]